MLYGICCTVSAVSASMRVTPPKDTAGFGQLGSIGLTDRIGWVGLAACGSALLLAITAHLTNNVAAIPLLWAIPLALYLLSFILCFDSPRWYNRPALAILSVVAMTSLVQAVLREGSAASPQSIVWTVASSCFAVFVLFMVCHGELSTRRPKQEHLTEFYLWTSVGGAVGGFLISFVAPLILSRLVDLPIILCVISVLLAFLLWSNPSGDAASFPFFPGLRTTFGTLAIIASLPFAYACIRWGWGTKSAFRPAHDWLFLALLSLPMIYVRCVRQTDLHSWRNALRISTFLFTCSCVLLLARSAVQDSPGIRIHMRNFYAALAVFDVTSSPPGRVARTLVNGTIIHGLQRLEPDVRRQPTAYYSPKSGVGVTLTYLMSKGPVNTGIIGLGTGALAGWGRDGDRYRFYEVNPQVDALARHEFTFLGDSLAQVSVIMGDGRRSLEAEAPNEFDLLVVDAFSGDSIPVHLLTREAFKTYLQHLKSEGVLAVHITNNYLELDAVVFMAAFELGLTAKLVDQPADLENQGFPSRWVLASRSAEVFESAALRDRAKNINPLDNLETWTDDFSNVFRILK